MREPRKASGSQRTKVDPVGLAIFAVALGGLVLLGKGVNLVTQIAYSNPVEAKDGRALIAVAAGVLTVAGGVAYVARGRWRGALIAAPGLVCLLLTVPFPDANTLFPFLALAALGAPAFFAALDCCFRWKTQGPP